MVKAVLFDLDGTLLPMSQEEFMKVYMGYLTKKLEPYGYKPKELVDALWKGTFAMMSNDGKASNETVFWNFFCGIYGEKARGDEPIFREFYGNEFKHAKDVCGTQPEAPGLIAFLKGKGCRLILATNPMFPQIATDLRTEWAGLKPSDFELCTYYENFNFGKPNPEYFAEILRRTGLKAEDCLMVGNDLSEDYEAATKVGIRTYIVTDNLIDRKNRGLEGVEHGTFHEMVGFVKSFF